MLRRFVSFNRSYARYLRRRLPSIFDSPSRDEELKRRVLASIGELHADTIVEVGGIDRPLLSKSNTYTYVGVDIESNDRCHDVYDRFIVQSIEKPLALPAKVVLSYGLLEHVQDNAAAIANIAAALEPGGATHHYVPSKWHPYSIALRLVGPVAQKKLIEVLRPGAESETGYRAFFDHCSTGAMRKLFKKNGLVSVDTRVYYRANDYFEFFLPAYILVSLFENLCQVLRLEIFASGFVISARKPPSS